MGCLGCPAGDFHYLGCSAGGAGVIFYILSSHWGGLGCPAGGDFGLSLSGLSTRRSRGPETEELDGGGASQSTCVRLQEQLTVLTQKPSQLAKATN